MQLKTSIFCFALTCCNCSNTPVPPKEKSVQHDSASFPANIPSLLVKVQSVSLPDGYSRVTYDSASFGWFLRNVGLKKDRKVYLFNGSLKQNQQAQFAVLDVSVGTKDLQQCADAVMRLRAEYHFARQQFDQIEFIDNERKKYRFTPPYTRTNFTGFLQKVFGMCGSASLEMQLKPKPDLTKIKIGDVFIKGGFPGHAVIVMDLAENEQGEKIFLLAQSYMPAQDIHLLKNPSNGADDPWYAISDIKNYLYTPEYTFTNQQLRTW